MHPLTPSTLPANLLRILLLSLFASLISSVPSEDRPFGINCQGSSQCSFSNIDTPNLLYKFNTTASFGVYAPVDDVLPGGPIRDRELWFSGEHIICAENNNHLIGSFCLFLQGDYVPKNGVPGSVIKQRINDLVYHGCRFCGSVPVLGNNQPFDAGVLTSNYVTGKGCQGVCQQHRDSIFLQRGSAWTSMNRTGGQNQRGQGH